MTVDDFAWLTTGSSHSLGPFCWKLLCKVPLSFQGTAQVMHLQELQQLRYLLQPTNRKEFVLQQDCCSIEVL